MIRWRNSPASWRAGIRRTCRRCIPIHPPEVWGCGCTYETSAAFRDAEHGTREGMYAYVYREARPEIFFKGTARVCVGRGRPIGIRSDSQVHGAGAGTGAGAGQPAARIAGYTLANDVSAWDIERENALYLTQSKVYDACCALGPVIVTPDELADPVQARDDLHGRRATGKELFAGGTSTARLHRQHRDAGGVSDAREPRARRDRAADRHRHHRHRRRRRWRRATW